jgi:excisionase family DNA binding protein
MKQKYSSVKSLSQYSGTSKSTIYQWIKEGRLEVTHIGKRLIVNIQKFDDLMELNTTKAITPDQKAKNILEEL